MTIKAKELIENIENLAHQLDSVMDLKILFVFFNETVSIHEKAKCLKEMQIKFKHDEESLKMFNEIAINRFSTINSFYDADHYFQKIIEPYLSDMGTVQLETLLYVMRCNTQILNKERKGSEAEFKKVERALEMKKQNVIE